jgi:hypothetical protein
MPPTFSPNPEAWKASSPCTPKVAKEDIRRNRDNAGEQLEFLGRVIHGTNPRTWLKEMRQRLGEKIDFASAVAD